MPIIRGDKRVADIYLGEYMRLRRHHNYRDIAIKVDETAGEQGPYYLKSSNIWTKGFYTPSSVKNKRRETFAAS